MKIQDILKTVDHTLLKQTATWEEIRNLCEEGMQYGTASVCIPPCFVKRAAAYLQGRLPVCTVIGFPNGYSTSASKVFEAREAVENGADEVDMVINLGLVKDKRDDLLLQEIRLVKEACGDKILKVIVETCLLNEEEKVRMCRVVTESGADFIKTSTGFSSAGATFEDIRLFKENVGEDVKIKAAGGISSLEDAEKFISLGADRLGTSRIVKLAKAMEQGKQAQNDGSY